MTTDVTAFDAAAEYDRQVARLVDLGYPAIAGRSRGDFEALLAPLRDLAVAHAGSLRAPSRSRVPFVVVVTRAVVPAERSMPLTSLTLRRQAGPGAVDQW